MTEAELTKAIFRLEDRIRDQDSVIAKARKRYEAALEVLIECRVLKSTAESVSGPIRTAKDRGD